MSRNPAAAKRRTDPRVQRTRDALGDALIALLREKPFASITVQDVLDRADVGRATFYAHFRDKDDLFLSDAEEFFEAISTALSQHGDRSDRVAPVREFFAHVAHVGPLYAAMVASGKMHDLNELARGHFARGIERRMAELPRGRAIPSERRAALAHAHAGALMSLLSFWLDREMSQSPEKMDDLFHDMVWSGVGKADPDAPGLACPAVTQHVTNDGCP